MIWTLLYEAVLKKKVWKNKLHDVEILNHTIIKEWRDYSQEIIDNAIDSFHKILR